MRRRLRRKHIALAITGGLLYILIETLWRGYSHWTMFVVGGLCFFLVGAINEVTPKMALVKQMALSCVIITAIEFLSGCILNIGLGLDIWDYSDEFGNLFGQICLKHSCYWFLLSLVGIVLDDYIRYRLFQEPKPKYTLF